MLFIYSVQFVVFIFCMFPFPNRQRFNRRWKFSDQTPRGTLKQITSGLLSHGFETVMLPNSALAERYYTCGHMYSYICYIIHADICIHIFAILYMQTYIFIYMLLFGLLYRINKPKKLLQDNSFLFLFICIFIYLFINFILFLFLFYSVVFKRQMAC